MIGKFRIFIVIFLPAALALLGALALVQQRHQAISRIQFEEQLQNQWLLVSIIQRSAMDSESFREISRSLGLRVTLVESSGVVALDTAADEDRLEDHADREEIRGAFLGVPTMAVRRSRSTGTPTIYYARLLEPGLVLRVAYPADYFDRMESALMTQAFSGLVTLILAVALFALAASRATGRTFRRLGLAVAEAESGGERIPSFGEEALDTALHSLSAASRELKAVAAEKERLGTRLAYILERVQEGVVLLAGDDIVYHNERARQILNCELPATLAELTRPDVLAVFERLMSESPPGSLVASGRTVSVDYSLDGPTRLIVLHDVTDREKYAGFKTELIANISHELKTPLTLIMTTSELIVKDEGMTREYLARFLGVIHNNARRLNVILDDLIDLHRLETIGALEPAETSLEEIVSEVRDLVDLGGKTVTWRCDPGRAAVHPSHVTSVLTNLLSNAVRYSTAPAITVEVLLGPDALEIRVADGGPAIPPAERERIFERFYSISSSRCRDSSGSGLGLAIVKHVARIYGGQARVEDNDRGGNTFVVRLARRVNS
jgi:two-component system phosphate regulon sensor histidine kinase PhoR